LKKFNKIGEYYFNEEKKQVSRKIVNVKISTRTCLVYIFLINNQCKYIGKTIQGYRRPLGYHKNKYMPTVHNNILKAVKSGDIVEVFCRVFNENDKILFEDVLINPFSAYEEALINKIGVTNLWNNQKY
tara:strand:- start:364 stop:750 length:387 start_codon:yes stop_codon:yes gene_type:complete